MALTNIKRQQEIAQQAGPVRSNNAYNGMNGVSQNTGANVGNYQQGYKPSDNVTAANKRLQQIETQKPSAWNSPYGAQLQSIYDQIVNPNGFKYEFNGDNLFKNYADLYTQQGRQASADTMARAAGLTGGYGNSYAQQAGGQAYQQYLLSLYDKGIDLANMAQNRYYNDRQNLQNAAGIMQNAEQIGYGQYRDTVGDWQTERDYQTNRADTEYSRDYSDYVNNRDYWTNLAAQENAAANQDRAFTEQQRQYDQSMAEQQRQYDTSLTENQRQFNTEMDYKNAGLAQDQQQFEATNKLNYDKLAQDQAQFDAKLTEEQRQYNQNLAIDYCTAILANGQIPTTELLVAAGISYEDAQKLVAQATGGGYITWPTDNGTYDRNGDGNVKKDAYTEGSKSKYDLTKDEYETARKAAMKVEKYGEEVESTDRDIFGNEKKNRTKVIK